ncbi:MAG: hypothetical protein BWX73_00941 [Lentisphaerae bacterium ADurb.Bin082]|nr:MAG: hypothetical protein BWX73_00941 [Lentisphaerae bacterium ADurb.Bin082]
MLLLAHVDSQEVADSLYLNLSLLTVADVRARVGGYDAYEDAEELFNELVARYTKRLFEYSDFELRENAEAYLTGLIEALKGFAKCSSEFRSMLGDAPYMKM